MNYKSYYDSPIGKYLIVCNEKALIGLWKVNQKYYPKDDFILNDEFILIKEVKKWLDEYFRGNNTTLSILIEPRGSQFYQKVWHILCSIPYGQVITYGEIAKTIAKEMGKETMSAQAVGQAVGHNPISLIIPCHRVVGKNKSLTGYAGGIETKIKLLELEGIDVKQYKKPR